MFTLRRYTFVEMALTALLLIGVGSGCAGAPGRAQADPVSAISSGVSSDLQPTLATLWTVSPVPTARPTPPVTSMPTEAPPFISLVSGQPTLPFALIFKADTTVQSIRSDNTAGQYVLADSDAKMSHFVAGQSVGVEKWGSPSPDGKKLVVTMSNVASQQMLPKGETPQLALYVVDIGSGDMQLLAEHATSPAWSPDGHWIAYRSDETKGLWVINPTTGETREVYGVDQESEHYVSDISWAPDGQRIAFLDNVIRQPRALVVVDIAGSTSSKVLIPASDDFVYSPQWSPTDDKILYVSTAGKSSSRTAYNLWIINADGSGQKQLTQDVDIVAGMPTWAPMGKWIVFAGIALYEKQQEMGDIWLIDETGQQLKRVTTNTPDATYETNPHWSPDGAQIAFIRDGKEAWILHLVDGVYVHLDVDIADFEDFIAIR